MASDTATLDQLTAYPRRKSANGIERRPDVVLQGKSTYRMQRRSQVIRVVSGCAWITFGGVDFVVYGGEELTLAPGKDSAVISSANELALVFTIEG
jgi:hypothetical protein